MSENLNEWPWQAVTVCYLCGMGLHMFGLAVLPKRSPLFHNEVLFWAWLILWPAVTPIALPILAAQWAWRKWRGRKVVSTFTNQETYHDAPKIVVRPPDGFDLQPVAPFHRRDTYYNVPKPQPDAPYGSKPDPAAAPVSRRELKLLWEDMEQFVNSRVGGLEARRIEKPVEKCGRCGGGGSVLGSGLWWVCPRCNGTGREDNNG